MERGLDIINIKLKDEDNKFDRQVVNGLGEKLFLIKGTELDTIERELKALEVIRKHKMIWFDFLLRTENVESYNRTLLAYYEYDEDTIKEFCLTQEEFYLLKEILKNG